MLTRAKVAKKKFLGGHATRNASHKDPLYGISYPPDHLRIVSFFGDPEDITRGILLFDRDLGPLPGEVNMWVGDRKGTGLQLIHPRQVRVPFNCPLYTSMAWSWDPSGGDFTGKDGCKYALAASGNLQEASGPYPTGKIWITGITRYDTITLDFAFSQNVNTTGDPYGFWATNESGYVISGTSVYQQEGAVIRVTFSETIAPAPIHGGLIVGFSGIVEYADLLSPITWRF